uniref:Uncharacterized protein n=1 Tax=Acrobeloides nanus TaxID=290746 RepID=A0A914EPU4_9BILA
MNWPEYHIRNAYDRDYIPPDFTSRAYYRELVHPDIGANPNMRYDNYLTSRLHDRDNFYRRPTRPIYYQNYPSYRNVEAVTRYNGRSERVRTSPLKP